MAKSNYSVVFWLIMLLWGAVMLLVSSASGYVGFRMERVNGVKLLIDLLRTDAIVGIANVIICFCFIAFPIKGLKILNTTFFILASIAKACIVVMYYFEYFVCHLSDLSHCIVMNVVLLFQLWIFYKVFTKNNNKT